MTIFLCIFAGEPAEMMTMPPIKHESNAEDKRRSSALRRREEHRLHGVLASALSCACVLMLSCAHSRVLAPVRSRVLALRLRFSVEAKAREAASKNPLFHGIIVGIYCCVEDVATECFT